MAISQIFTGTTPESRAPSPSRLPATAVTTTLTAFYRHVMGGWAEDPRGLSLGASLHQRAAVWPNGQSVSPLPDQRPSVEGFRGSSLFRVPVRSFLFHFPVPTTGEPGLQLVRSAPGPAPTWPGPRVPSVSFGTVRHPGISLLHFFTPCDSRSIDTSTSCCL